MHITEKQLKLVTEIASQEAIKAYRQYTDRQQKEKYDWRLRNIKLLLRNYRSLVEHCKDVEDDIRELDDELESTIIDQEEFAIEAIKRSKKRTLAMVRFIKRMVAAYESMCEEDGPEAIRQFEVLKRMYLIEQKNSIKEIANVLFLSEKTIKRDRDKAIETLAVLIFGIDAVKLK